MAINYLRDLRRATLPLAVTEPGAVRKVEMLLVAHLIDATLDRAGEFSLPHAATVFGITPAGRAMLERMDSRKPR